ncbi:MAG: bifunctional 5,10-methylenetetrahydrofolate dehydrogenase/5,10-methenyltetrahydrofolate cyclohydrolase [Thermoplasmataceae archaeon]
MTEQILGGPLAERMVESLKARVTSLKDHGIDPHLFLVQVGSDEATETYVRAKVKRGNKIGIKVSHQKFDVGITYEKLIEEINSISLDEEVSGVMVENPLPKHLDFFKVVENIPFYKDVDGMTATNQGMIALRNEFLVPATAAAVVELISDVKPPQGSSVAIINRSPIVGKPLAMMLINRDFTVTVCHSKTPDIRKITKASDIIVPAVGKLNFLDRSYVSENSIIVDVGINAVENGIKGDANYEELNGFVRAITPVPGGVGPLTATLIMENTVRAAEYKRSHR